MENFTPQHLAAHEDGAVVRVSCTLKDSEAVMQRFPGAAVARAGSGVCYGYFETARAAVQWLAGAAVPRMQGGNRICVRGARGERWTCGLRRAAILR